MAVSRGVIRRLIIALSSAKAGSEVVGSLGSYGGFQLNSNGTIKNTTGAISVAADSGGAPGTYRIFFPDINANIQSIDWFEVAGFTPRTPTGVETDQPRVCGYNFDASTNNWYVTVQIANLSTGAAELPPQGFVVGIRAAFTFKPDSIQL